MVSCSAPGKIYLFGEHAVVYGETAIGCAVELRTRVRAELHNSIIIQSEIGQTGIDFEKHPYISAAIEKIREIRPIDGVFLEVDSDIPVGSGLSSSAAVTIASLGALNELFGCGLSLEEIAKMGHEIEVQVQGAASPTDTYVSTFGGVVSINDRRKLRTPDCGIVVGNTGVFASTKELVANVRKLRESYPNVVEPLMAVIGRTSRIAEPFFQTGDYPSIGKLMNVNQGLLDALGVNTYELSNLIYAARKAGAFGAKLTGGGGGGCMVALTAPDKCRQVAEAIENAGGKAIITKPTEQGLKLE
ncbi:MAG: mevalonate kinase [Methanosarcina thermophila]|jgi:mevalonate kinase|uniref:Mevalonate kinase n=3 Tax=Methanosarcina thermophila TaxID=2210 RepID=A0A1I6YSE1_METTE|nr:mevalonate kinase [Methanosarcina thermophila]ALK05121.1 MAG: mevalonate kinase [Methanosarcina sp. 795]AKB13875.1 Mevalonate kinase [Methanosarcina thermophila TM-1]AKB15485.1 Mevalonate kinase [Methanosarcina thermophila CHTI-55]NLU56354.1 mevalonate kinase [Methanosarcina thermophila]SFT53151.1 mevalonate kinase [Methanosarcina thermophila]